MENLSKGLTIFIGIFTFFIICILGIIAQVSWGVIFLRSISAALIVSSLTYATCFLIYNLAIKEYITDAKDAVNFEYIADEDNFFTQNLKDSTIENIINQDPQKAADILRKMGLDE